MKYQKWYDALIERARGRQLNEYFERHHIIPRCLGGADDDENLVDLTYREHFLAHWLLVKIASGRDRALMWRAFSAMAMPLAQRRMSSWQFEVIKRHLRDLYLATLEKRRDRVRAEKRQTLCQIQQRIDEISSIAGTLTLSRDISTVTQAAKDWLKTEPRRMNKLRHRRLSRVLRKPLKHVG